MDRVFAVTTFRRIRPTYSGFGTSPNSSKNSIRLFLEPIRGVHQPDINSTNLVVGSGPLPTPQSPSDHLVKVHATALCLGELSWAKNFPSMFPEPREPVPCSDLAGTVVWAPHDSPFKAGDEVFAHTGPTRAGTAWDYTIARTSELALKPRRFDWIQTAATPLSTLTPWQGLLLHAALDSAAIHGERAALELNAQKLVLATAAGGSVGSWTVQLAASISVWVKQEPTQREGNLILDCIGGETLESAWDAIKDGGSFLAIVADPMSEKPRECTKTPAVAKWFLVQPLGSNLKEIAELIDKNEKFEPLVDRVLPLEDISKAFEIVEDRHAKGKVVITISV
ncbi:putative zinc-binding oxidoreductase [Gonapodya prolifera JEL478]|uniref:Putative zinc-binding oxidoreductase n=1 Tax=Gonapodya prolifera (strain JEL478) TaxID=1344416 RepID=A0A139AF62_GONPJ|nr:putative zinc-binding oxidoreductase [Gonapodya prolifera JEL478]|eukprot:KXS15451.1 putative zinc-binding oxidoreductase [Gonapodya prolifera JEL478]